jgi:hypothetical protein
VEGDGLKTPTGKYRYLPVFFATGALLFPLFASRMLTLVGELRATAKEGTEFLLLTICQASSFLSFV